MSPTVGVIVNPVQAGNVARRHERYPTEEHDTIHNSCGRESCVAQAKMKNMSRSNEQRHGWYWLQLNLWYMLTNRRAICLHGGYSLNGGEVVNRKIR